MRKYIKLATLLLNVCCFANYICTSVAPGDTFNSILKKQNIARSSIDEINASLPKTSIISKLSPEDEIALYAPKDNVLVSAYIKQKKKHYVINKENNGFHSTEIKVDDSIKLIKIDASRDAENLDQLIAKRAASALFPNDTGLIQAAFKDKTLISLKVSTHDKTKYAFLHQDDGFPVYVDQSGKVLSQAISRTPTEYLWISSPFNPHRLHPISKKIRPHNGVDLAALINTPIWAAADGKVIHKSSDTGFGNFLIIDHGNHVKTCYAHLNKFHNNIQVGQTIRAFETIGYVGSTGISEGNHLHFEVHINDQPQDPLTVELSPIKEISTLAPSFYF